MTFYEMLEYGPIVACDEDIGYLVTINGSYLLLWLYDGEHWDNVDCRSGHPDLYILTVAQAMDLGRAWITEVTE